MSGSDAVFDIIQQVAATGSKNGKQDILAKNAANATLQRVLVAALDPFTTYGLAKRPLEVAPGAAGTEEFEADTWLVLEKLAKRELTGNAAIDAVTEQLGALTYASAELFWRIISKDLRAGFSESTVNKAIPGLITTFDCMLAHAYEEKRVTKFPQIVEPKLDGVRVLAFVRPAAGKVHFYSRSGKEFTTFDHLKAPLLAKAAGREDLVFDGEMVSGSFNKTVGDVRRKSEQAVDAVFYVFDVLKLATFNLDGKDGVGHAYVNRRKQLMEIFGTADADEPVRMKMAFLVDSHEAIQERYSWARSLGLEGIIVKDPNAFYHRRRNHGWMKVKNESTVDVKIVGAEEGTGKFVGCLGALVVEYKGKRVNVGSGLTDAQRVEFWANRAELANRLIEVEYHEETPDGSLRHPRFVRFRDDKPLKEAA